VRYYYTVTCFVANEVGFTSLAAWQAYQEYYMNKEQKNLTDS